MTQPLVSIIIPTFNRAHILVETLDSILAQTYTNWECIVVDDGSSDNTKDLLSIYIKKDSRFFYHKRPRDRKKGANACRNYGFDISKGDFLNWFDDDDIMHPEKLQIQVKALVDSKDKFSICQSLCFDKTIENILDKPLYNLYSKSIFYDYLQMKIKWLTQAPMWKRDFLCKQEYLFDEELQAAQEWEFHCRMYYFSPSYHITETPLVYIRKHDSSITYNTNKDQRLWHYFLARLKIYKNTKLHLDDNSKRFLKNYLINSFKKMIVTQNPSSVKAYYKYLLVDGGIPFWAKWNALIAIFTYRYFNKGNMFLQKIKYPK